jgi:hypothetical protein
MTSHVCTYGKNSQQLDKPPAASFPPENLLSCYRLFVSLITFEKKSCFTT